MTKQEKEFMSNAFRYSIRGKIIAGLELGIPISVVMGLLPYLLRVKTSSDFENSIFFYLIWAFSFLGPFIHGFIVSNCILSSYLRPTKKEFDEYQIAEIKRIERIRKNGGEWHTHNGYTWFSKADLKKLKT